MADWFAPKRYGLGCGFPIAWQGWLLSALFVAVATGAVFLFEKQPVAILSIVLPAAALFLLIAARTTRGGWRWRWGGVGDTDHDHVRSCRRRGSGWCPDDNGGA